MKDQIPVYVRWLIRRDHSEALACESGWTEDDFVAATRDRSVICMVAEVGERVVAVMAYELRKRKIHLLNFAVHPEFRRCRVGSQMIATLIGKLSSHRRTRITADVPEEALDLQLFLRSEGFEAVRVDREEATYRFVYRLPVPIVEEIYQ